MSDTENQEAEVTDEAVEALEAVEVDPAEAKARSKGWVGLEEWTEQGKDANDWAPYKFFNEKGDMIGQIQQLKRQTKEFDSRLAQSNEAWKARLDIEKASLLEQRDDAIDLSDKDKVKSLDKQINSINEQQANLSQPVAPQLDPQDLAVENQYFNSLASKPKQLFASVVATQFVNQGLTGQALVDAIDKEVIKEFPPQNARRQAAPVTDSPRKQSKAKQDVSLDSLTKEDKQMLTAMKSFPSFKGKTDAEILKAIEDTKR